MSRATPPDHHASLADQARPTAPTLPVPLTTFVGRDRDVATVVDLLRRPDMRLLTITGTGGVGKTRLALRGSEAVRDAFDGTAFISLASVRDPDMLLPTIAHLLNVPDAPGQPLLSRLRTFLAHLDLLLVLDNLEHLLDAVPGVVDLLATCPRLTILCTSRTPLNVSGERLMPLSPLPIEEASVLFTERVRAAMPSFTVTDELAPVIDLISARLDGLPLAIELAASRVPTLPPHALLTRLERRLDLLIHGPRDAPARLRDMRDAIGWSHDLLPEKQQMLFRRLSVFIGGFTLEAAEAVAGDAIDVFEGVSALITASLVVMTEGVADEPRYTMLETVREYALERLAAAGEEASVRARHAEYYRSLAESSLPLYDGPNIRLASDRVDIELDNCRAAMTWALEERAAETGVRLAGALWRIWQFVGATVGRPWTERVVEGQSWIERMLCMQDGLPVEALAEALTGAGRLAMLQDDPERAQVAAEELLARAQAESYPYGNYWAIGLLGSIAENCGQYERARSYYARGLTLAPDMRNPQNHLAIAYFSLGNVALRSGDLGLAATELGEALRLSRETGNQFVIACAASKLGLVFREQGDLHHAAALAREGLVAYMAQGQLSEVHALLVDLACVALTTDQPERAVRLLGVAEGYPSDERDANVATHAATDAKARLDEEAYTASFQVGRQMAWDESLTEIDELIAATPPMTLPKPASQHGLSRREVEVLRLLSEGHSNRAIAETLSLSERTIENHVFHICNKLNVSSRTAAAAHAVRHDLI